MSSFLTCSGKWLIPFDPALTEMDTFTPGQVQGGQGAHDVQVRQVLPPLFLIKFVWLPCPQAALPRKCLHAGGPHGEDERPSHPEDYLTWSLVDTWLRNMKTRCGSPVAQLSLSFLWALPISSVPVLPHSGLPDGRAAFVLFFHSVTVYHTAWLLVHSASPYQKALPLVRHCDACATALLSRSSRSTEICRWAAGKARPRR